MTDSIRHRGPDGEGYLLASPEKFVCAFSDDTPLFSRQNNFRYSPTADVQSVNEIFPVQLGHRRLSIIDLSPAGHQPMCSEDTRYWITYNGEIYNYIELREELKQHGFIFRTKTDIEVILHSYEKWGADCVKHFNGMWAFVIYDRKENLLFGSRDRFGVKPFYYFRNENHFAFASEQKALLTLPFVPKEINHKAAFDFFALNKLETEAEGLYKNIFELPTAHSFTLKISNGDFKLIKYYELKWNKSFESFNEHQSQQHANAIRKLLKTAIAIRLRSDAPVGTCLSGGIDSSAIVCMVNELMNENNYSQVGNLQNAFTTCFSESNFNEEHWAKTVVDKTKTKWHRVFPTQKDFAADFEKLIYAHDVPIWSTSSYAHYRVMQLAKESGVKVLLDGQGGDELFGGYKQYELSLLNEYKSNSQQKEYSEEKKYFEQLNGKNFLTRLRLKRRVEQGKSLSLKKIFFTELKNVNPDLLRQYRDRWEQKIFTSSLNETLQNDFNGNYLKELLLREDRNGMIHSVESRTPFADDVPLIEYVFSIAGTYKIRNARSKYLLRESVKDIIPKAIYNRRDKMGFASPNNKWMSESREQFRSYFTAELSDFINVNLLLKNFDKLFHNPSKPENYRTLKFVSFAAWMKIFGMK